MNARSSLVGVALAGALLATLAAPAFAGAPVLEDRGVAIYGALRMLALENADGTFPGEVRPTRDACGCEDVAGLAAIALLRGFELNGYASFLDGAASTAAYLEAAHGAGALLAPTSLSFLAEYGGLAADATALATGRAAYERAVAAHGDARTLANDTLNAGAPNLGFLALGLWATAASEAGHKGDANDFAAVGNSRAVEMEPSVAGYGLALAGLLTANAQGYVDSFEQAQAVDQALGARQATDGSVDGSVLATSHAALAFDLAGDFSRARESTTWVNARSSQSGQLGWLEGGIESSGTDSVAIQALAAAVMPGEPGFRSYALTAASSVAGAATGPLPSPSPSTCSGYPVTPATPDGTGPWPTDCPPAGNLVYAWVCVGYAGNVDHFGTSLGFPFPGASTPHPLQDAAIAQAIAADAAGGSFDGGNLYWAATAQGTSTGSPCGQFVP